MSILLIFILTWFGYQIVAHEICDQIKFVKNQEDCQEKGKFPIPFNCDVYFNCTGSKTGEEVTCKKSEYFNGHNCTLIPILYKNNTDYCLQIKCFLRKRSDDDFEPWATAPFFPGHGPADPTKTNKSHDHNSSAYKFPSCSIVMIFILLPVLTHNFVLH